MKNNLLIALLVVSVFCLIGCGGGGGDGGGGGNTLEDQVFNIINQTRQANGLAPLARNATLDALAASFAQQIAAANQTNFDANHTGPDGKTAAQRMQGSGYNPVTWGENIAWSTGSNAQEIVNQWMNSPTHRANILKADFTETGIDIANNPGGGVFKYWWVQEFGDK
ncbi:MAG: CAP domain-containing protein [Armatimonadetes bacterium]|nr:CAP domain-containing protein [Armatimonadota bacterium]